MEIEKVARLTAGRGTEQKRNNDIGLERDSVSARGKESWGDGSSGRERISLKGG
jgi:hypothetical protein